MWNIQFKREESNSTPARMSDKTRLRILINQWRTRNPRRPSEDEDRYAERLARLIHARGLSHLSLGDTMFTADRWLWGALERKRIAQYEE